MSFITWLRVSEQYNFRLSLNHFLHFRRAFENIFNVLEQNGECLMVLVANNPVFDVYRTLEKDGKWSPFVYDVEKYISPYHDFQVSLFNF